MPELILASTSSYRRRLLERLGLPFTAMTPRVDEEALKDPRLSPQELAEKLAAAKADSLAVEHADAVIIGSDQVCAVGSQILGKPGSAERAVEQLTALSGREHQLITAVAVRRGSVLRQFTDVTTLRMRKLERAAIERYVQADRPVDCAGSYKLEERGITLFESIQSADHSAIVGLPLMALTTLLRTSFGFETP